MFYKKNKEGEFVEAQESVNGLIADRLDQFKRSESDKVRKEAEDRLRKDLRTEIEKDVRTELDKEYKPKIEKYETEVKTLGTQLLQKTIAAEYGFSSKLEGLLGDGSEEDMRATADTLKGEFAASGDVKSPTKETATDVKTGFVSYSE